MTHPINKAQAHLNLIKCESPKLDLPLKVSDRLKSDYHIVLRAISNNGYALQFANVQETVKPGVAVPRVWSKL